MKTRIYSQHQSMSMSIVIEMAIKVAMAMAIIMAIIMAIMSTWSEDSHLLSASVIAIDIAFTFGPWTNTASS